MKRREISAGTVEMRPSSILIWVMGEGNVSRRVGVVKSESMKMGGTRARGERNRVWTFGDADKRQCSVGNSGRERESGENEKRLGFARLEFERPSRGKT